MRVAADPAEVTIFAHPGQGGVTLDAPKRLALTGDTLWVTDIDAVRDSRGQFDGVEGLPGGRMLVTSWERAAVYLVTDSASRRIIGGLVSPADIGLDTRRNVLAIPLPRRDRGEYWKLSRR